MTKQDQWIAEQHQRIADLDKRKSEDIERLKRQIPSYAANFLTDVLKKLHKSVKTSPSYPWFLKSIIPQPLWKKGPLQDFMGLANLSANTSLIMRRASTLPGMKVELPCQGQESPATQRALRTLRETFEDSQSQNEEFKKSE
jgi:hypothetical protein